MTTSRHENEKVRFYFQDLTEDGFNNRTSDQLILKEGRLPEEPDEILVRYQPNVNFQYKIGDIITFDGSNTIDETNDGFYQGYMNVFINAEDGQGGIINGDYRISGIIIDTLYMNMLEEPTYFPYGYTNPNEKGEDITNIFYFPTKYTTTGDVNSNTPIGEYFDDFFSNFGVLGNECYMKISGLENYDIFSDNYIKLINKLVAFGHAWNFITLDNGNSSYIAFKSLAKNMGIISSIFPVLFTLITALILYIIIERFIIDQRQSIACLLTQGVSNSRIYARVLYIGIFASIIGSIAGFILG